MLVALDRVSFLIPTKPRTPTELAPAGAAEHDGEPLRDRAGRVCVHERRVAAVSRARALRAPACAPGARRRGASSPRAPRPTARAGSPCRRARARPSSSRFWARDEDAGARRAELVARPAAGDDHGEARRHRLGDGQPESLAAIGVHERLARRVEPGNLVPVEVLSDVEDLGRVGVGRELADRRPRSSGRGTRTSGRSP